MPFLQNSISQDRNAQASEAWLLQKPAGLGHEFVFPKGSLPQIRFPTANP